MIQPRHVPGVPPMRENGGMTASGGMIVSSSMRQQSRMMARFPCHAASLLQLAMCRYCDRSRTYNDAVASDLHARANHSRLDHGALANVHVVTNLHRDERQSSVLHPVIRTDITCRYNARSCTYAGTTRVEGFTTHFSRSTHILPSDTLARSARTTASASMIACRHARAGLSTPLRTTVRILRPHLAAQDDVARAA